MKLFSFKSSIKTVLILLLASTVSACGFHLRGNYLVPAEISEVSLTSFDQYSKLTRDVASQLRLNDIEIVAPSETVPNIHLVSEGVGERTLSLYQNARAAEKQLTYTSSFRVTIPERGTKVYSTTVTRNYLDNPRTALAKSVERELIVDEMREQASVQILRQMARIKAELINKLTEEELVAETENTVKVH
ncbi:LPS-assembly lipoprotein LptE [Vibrio sp. SCSIO 43137]|uniref:LPS-assembly lipoprotein LptE n=1 Tax=Vibrio sp. SCSIO 43137 TaxID=3021011 RepID=UPI0023074A11|nr:LPS assembly lipoprotein LptE [Vibrio sp. SCSIO 43137]WCE29036.1 LPS assembly lipoprotein LptE [Vibrio sp. SCSIO 43137]